MTTAWHTQALTLRKSGWTVKEIAEFLEKDESTVRWALDENDARLKQRERVRRQRSRKRKAATMTYSPSGVPASPASSSTRCGDAAADTPSPVAVSSSLDLPALSGAGLFGRSIRAPLIRGR
jgi:DNA-binding transcriptional MerR regulator